MHIKIENNKYIQTIIRKHPNTIIESAKYIY